MLYYNPETPNNIVAVCIGYTTETRKLNLRLPIYKPLFTEGHGSNTD